MYQAKYGGPNLKKIKKEWSDAPRNNPYKVRTNHIKIMNIHLHSLYFFTL